MNTITEILSGFTISMLMIPEAIAFSMLLGLAPIMGMNATMIISFITSLLGGQPGLISGATGSVATTLIGVTKNIGKEYIVIAVILGGIFQIIFGLTGVTKYFDKIPEPVMSGFLIGLAVLILKSQLMNFKDKETGDWISKHKLLYTILLTLLGIFVSRFSYYLPGSNVIPPALYGIAIVTLVAYVMKSPVEKIKEKGDIHAQFPKIHMPQKLDMKTFLKLIPYAIGMAFVGLVESLIMLKDANKILGRKGDSVRETFAQGIANIASGFGNGIGGCVLVGQSKLNYSHGASTRLSSMSTSLSFGTLVIFLSKYIGNVPMPALIATMFDIAVRTGDWKSLHPRNGGKNLFSTTVTALSSIFADNLAVGVVIGTIVHFIINNFVKDT